MHFTPLSSTIDYPYPILSRRYGLFALLALGAVAMQSSPVRGQWQGAPKLAAASASASAERHLAAPLAGRPISPASNPSPGSPEAVVSRTPLPTVDPWLQAALEPLEGRFSGVLATPEAHRLQILVTRVTPSAAGGAPLVSSHAYRADAEYFYPASSIKTFVALAALRRLQESRSAEAPSSKAKVGQCAIGQSQRTQPAVCRHIETLLLASSNRSFNRLYDFIGGERLNRTLHQMGFRSVRLRHHLDGAEPHGGGGLTPWSGDDAWGDNPAPRLALGRAFRDDVGRMVHGPASFATKNYVSLGDLHQLLLSLARPDLPGAVDLGLSSDHRAFLLRALQGHPMRTVRGMGAVASLGAMRYAARGGRAYGFETENAYVEHRETGVALFVTATLYRNPNGIVNDNCYAYERLTTPFLRMLGSSLARRGFLR